MRACEPEIIEKRLPECLRAFRKPLYLAGGTEKLLKLFTENRHKRVEGRQTFCYTGNDRIFGQCSRNRAAGAGTARRRNERCPLPTHTAALAQMCWIICPRRCGKSWRRTGSCTISVCTGRMCCSITMRKKSTPVAALGNAMHDEPGRTFF